MNVPQRSLLAVIHLFTAVFTTLRLRDSVHYLPTIKEARAATNLLRHYFVKNCYE